MTSESAAAKELTLREFREANVTRCVKWHPEGIRSWSASDWMTAIVGELGELASLIKMRNRERDGLAGNKFSPTDEQIGKEAADVFTYLDLFCAAHGIDLAAATVAKFNEVSERVGFPDRILLERTQPSSAVEPVAEVVDEFSDDMRDRFIRCAIDFNPAIGTKLYAAHSSRTQMTGAAMPGGRGQNAEAESRKVDSATSDQQRVSNSALRGEPEKAREGK